MTVRQTPPPVLVVRETGQRRSPGSWESAEDEQLRCGSVPELPRGFEQERSA